MKTTTLKQLTQRLKSPGPKRILALDGGGIRGAISLGYLERMEQILRDQHDNPNLLLCDYFDLIGGTSTGAIIAAGLATGMTASEIKDIYLDIGGKIFGKKFNFIKAFRNGAKYDHAPLEKALQEVFGEITMGSDRIQTGLCIVTKRADTYSTWPVINNPIGAYDNDYLKLKDLLRATSAAPAYFMPKEMNVNPPNKPPQMAAFIDGGVSLANNPALQLFLIAQLKNFGLNWSLGAQNLLIASVGTGTYVKKGAWKDYSKKSLLGWAKAIPNLFMEDAGSMNRSLLQFMSSSPTAEVIDSEIGNLSNDLLFNQALFTYQRYNVLLDQTPLDKLKLSFSFDEKALVSLREMDHAVNRFKLAEIGEKDALGKVEQDHFSDAFQIKSL